MPEGRTFRSAGEQEDWLRTKGKLLAFITEVLANRLRIDVFAALPAQVEYLVFGYITPVAAEYVRRALWRDTTLSLYQKQMIYLFMLRMYTYIKSHYRGHFPNVEQCIDEIVHTPIPFASDDPIFDQMHGVTSKFDEHFRQEKQRGNCDDDMVFGTAFIVNVWQIVKQELGVDLPISAEDSALMLKDFDSTARRIRQMLAD